MDFHNFLNVLLQKLYIDLIKQELKCPDTHVLSQSKVNSSLFIHYLINECNSIESLL